MNVKFVDRKGEQPGKVHFYAEKKVGKLDRFFRSEGDATITFTNQKKGQVKVEVAINVDGVFYRGESTSTDPNASIDAAVAAIERQIRKNKTRLAKRMHNDNLVSILSEEPEVQEDEDELSIIRSKKFTIKPMTPEEAILQMNLIGHTFFVFRNADNGDSIAVVYSRNDGGYGLIEDDSE